jgi:hypothetical protein
MISSWIRRFAERYRNFLLRPTMEAVGQIPVAIGQIPVGAEPAVQTLLQFEYARLVREGKPLPTFGDVGFKVYSQCDEDGTLLFLFAVLGSKSKTSVEICAGDGRECNTANLIRNHGWYGLLVDGNKQAVDRGAQFFATSRDTYVFPPKFVCSWITRGNVNALLQEHGFQGEIDLLSLDLDGIDWWIWQALDVVSPRVVVLEYQDILGAERSWTVPYDDNFDASRFSKTNEMPNFAGASLAAFVKLGRSKGYRLVGVNRYGFNAFFVRNGVGDDLIPEVAASDCFTHPKALWGLKERFPMVEKLPWVEV